VDELAHPPVTLMSDQLIEQLVAADIAIVSTLAVMNSPNGAVSNLRRFSEAGGRIALGNDAGYLEGVLVGMPMNEIHALSEAGFDPMQIVAMATREAANVCGLDDRLGTLEAGKQADLLVIRGNPLADLNALSHPLLVIRKGIIIAEEES